MATNKKTSPATKTKKTRSTPISTKPKRSSKTHAADNESQFASIMVPVFAILSIIFLLIVIQNYL